MKSEAVQFLSALIALVVAGAAEDLLPKVAGVGFPVLMAASVFMAMRRSAPAGVMFALAAGAVEDALSGLPPATSSSFFLAVAALARWSDFPHGALVMAYPVYQVWVWMWMAGLNGSVFGRAIVAVPAGLVTALATWTALAWMERGAAAGEPGR